MKGILRPKMLAPLVAILLLGGGAFAATQVFHVNLRVVLGKKTEAASVTPTPQPAHSEERGIVFNTAERVVNLADQGQFRYLKAQVSLEFAMPKGKKVPEGKAYVEHQKKQEEELAPYKPRIDDTITTVLASKSSAELLKPEGKESVRRELVEKLRERLGEELGERLIQLYFVQFIIQ